MSIKIKPDTLENPELVQLIEDYHVFYHENTGDNAQPLATVYQLKTMDIKFWTAWEGGKPLGCAGLKYLEVGHGEPKCLFVREEGRGKGIGKLLIDHLIQYAKAEGFHRLSIEASTEKPFAAVMRIIKSQGFTFSAPFGDYFMDLNSQCMTLKL